MEAGVRTATDDNASDGGMLWLAATILLRLSEGRYVRAALWSCVLAFLVNIDAIWV